MFQGLMSVSLQMENLKCSMSSSSFCIVVLLALNLLSSDYHKYANFEVLNILKVTCTPYIFYLNNPLQRLFPLYNKKDNYASSLVLFLLPAGE